MTSVIMTTYNAGRTVKKALDSLLPVLDELGVEYETRDLGKYVAVSMSKGDYLLFYDADALC